MVKLASITLTAIITAMKSFQTIKDELVKPTVLILYDPSDISSLGLEAVLLQQIRIARNQWLLTLDPCLKQKGDMLRFNGGFGAHMGL